MKNLKTYTFLMVISFAFFQSATLYGQKAKNAAFFKKHLNKSYNVVGAGYNYTIEKVAKKSFIRKQYYRSKNHLFLLETYDSKKCKTKNGAFKKWTDAGVLFTQGFYNNDQKDGKWTHYHYETGIKSQTIEYKENKMNGLLSEFDSVGQLVAFFTYKNDILEGPYEIKNTALNIFEKGVFNNGIKEIEFSSDSTSIDSIEQSLLVETLPYMKNCEQLKEDKNLLKTCSENTLLQFIYSTIKYPYEDRYNDVTGSPLFSFIIEKDGRLTNIKVINGVSLTIEKECLRVIKLLPAFNPGQQNGKDVRVEFKLPLKFLLTD